MAEVFISYARKDQGFVRDLHAALLKVNRDAWIDWRSILESAKWRAQIFAAIEAADNFLFVISPDSVRSSMCAQEVSHADAKNKRLITILYHSVERKELPPALAEIQWIDYPELGFEQTFERLIAALDTDRDWERQHTRFRERATEWESKDRDQGFLLHGMELKEAVHWLGQAPTSKGRKSTELQEQYIRASEEWEAGEIQRLTDLTEEKEQQRREAERQRQEAARNMRIFDEVLQVISGELDNESLLQTIATQIGEKLNCSHCTIFLAETQENGEPLLVSKVTHGEFKEPLTRRFKTSEGLAGWVFTHGESVLLADAAKDHRFAPARMQRGKARSMLVVPVKVGDQTIGVISADVHAFDWFSVSDQRLVDALAAQAGIAIQRSRALKLLHDINASVVRHSLNVGEILRQVVSGAIRLTNTTTGVIYLISDDGLSVTDRFHPGDFDHPPPRMDNPNGLTRTAIRTGRVRVIPETSQDPSVTPRLPLFRSMIVVPMKIQDKVIGVFYLNDKNRHKFTEIEQTCLQTLASEAAIAIENARLVESLKLRLRSHRFVEDILRQLSVQQSDHDRTLDDIARRVRDILGEAVSTMVNLYNRDEKSLGTNHSYGPLSHGLLVALRTAETEMYVLETGRPLYLPDVTKPPDGCPTVRDEAIALGITSFAAIPLRRREQIVGVLCFGSHWPLAFDDETKNILEMLAGLAGLSIEIARLHAGAQ